MNIDEESGNTMEGDSLKKVMTIICVREVKHAGRYIKAADNV